MTQVHRVWMTLVTISRKKKYSKSTVTRKLEMVNIAVNVDIILQLVLYDWLRWLRYKSGFWERSSFKFQISLHFNYFQQNSIPPFESDKSQFQKFCI